MQVKGGFSGFLEFSNYLKKRGITYSIHQYDDESITLYITTVGARFEVSFFEDRFWFCIFKGSEGVNDSSSELIEAMNEHWSG